MIETERLYLRRHILEDDTFIFELMNQPSFFKYIGDRGVTSLDKAQKYLIDRHFYAYDTYGYGSFALCLKENDKVIGTCGFYHRPGLDIPDYGFAMLDEYAGKGYMKEASIELLSIAKPKYNLDKLCAITTQNNIKSIGLLERLGFQFVKKIFLPHDPEELFYFELEF